MSLIFVCIATLVIGGKAEFVSKEPETFNTRLQKAKQLLTEVPLIDGHNDVAWSINMEAHNLLRLFPFTKNLSEVEPWKSDPYSQTDLPRLRKGLVGGQFWSAYAPCTSSRTSLSARGYEQADLIKRLIDENSDDLKLALSSSDLLEAFTEGKIASLIGLEGGHMIDSSLSVMRSFYRYGLRYITLTHNCSTDWAQSSEDEENENSIVIGLSEFGEKVVKEMNELGMMVDISHVSKQTMDDVLNVTEAPVIFSHTNVRAICNVTRNVPDEVLKKMKKNGGIVMVSFYPSLLTCSDQATLHDVIDHINHVREVAGVKNVGIGGDFNGIRTVPDGLEDVSKYPNLFAELMLDPKWTIEDLKGLAGVNFLRVFKQVESVKSILTFQQSVKHKKELSFEKLPKREEED